MKFPFSIFQFGVVVAFILGAGVLAFQIGSRLSDEAIMTIVGVLCGIVASIPVSIGLLMALTNSSIFARPPEDVEWERGESGYLIPKRPQHQLTDWRIRQYIISTGTVPEHSNTRVWRQLVDGEECVFWQNSESSEIHYAPLLQITSGK